MQHSRYQIGFSNTKNREGSGNEDGLAKEDFIPISCVVACFEHCEQENCSFPDVNRTTNSLTNDSNFIMGIELSVVQISLNSLKLSDGKISRKNSEIQNSPRGTPGTSLASVYIN